MRDTVTREQFIDYLHYTLIPDMKNAGMTATAYDFETALLFILNPEFTRVVRDELHD